MPWSRIAFADGFDSANCQWVLTVFQHLYEHVPDDEFDELALYRDRLITGVTLYLSPRASARLRMAMSRFDLWDCPRPRAAEVELVLGPALAADPAWCDMLPLERLAEAELAYAELEEVRLPEEGEVTDVIFPRS